MSAALQKVRQILKRVKTDLAAIDASTSGKVYELVCLAELVQRLSSKGLNISFSAGHSKVKFKSSPGPVNHNYPRFVVTGPNLAQGWEIWTDVEFLTLSSNLGHNLDHSSYYEIDLLLTTPINDGDRPCHDEIIVGVECKARSSGLKDTIKQVLGIRRELCLLQGPSISRLSEATGGSTYVRAEPSSEYWLLHTDHRIGRYQDGPDFFGIEVTHLPV